MVDFTRKEKKIFGDIASLSKRLADDRLYEIVAEEISQGDLDPVAQLKALEKADGNEERARANYARHRIRRLKDMAAQYVIMEQVEAERQTEGQRLKRETAAFKSAEKIAAVAEPMAREINQQYSQSGKSAVKKTVGLVFLVAALSITLIVSFR